MGLSKLNNETEGILGDSPELNNCDLRLLITQCSDALNDVDSYNALKINLTRRV